MGFSSSPFLVTDTEGGTHLHDEAGTRSLSWSSHYGTYRLFSQVLVSSGSRRRGPFLPGALRPGLQPEGPHRGQRHPGMKPPAG